MSFPGRKRTLHNPRKKKTQDIGILNSYLTKNCDQGDTSWKTLCFSRWRSARPCDSSIRIFFAVNNFELLVWRSREKYVCKIRRVFLSCDTQTPLKKATSKCLYIIEYTFPTYNYFLKYQELTRDFYRSKLVLTVLTILQTIMSSFLSRWILISRAKVRRSLHSMWSFSGNIALNQ